jgi:hypothetical protein
MGEKERGKGDRASLYSPGWSGIHDPPVSVS